MQQNVSQYDSRLKGNNNNINHNIIHFRPFYITIGLEIFPSMNHKSAIVINPINVTWNKPTNLTLTQQAMVIPVNINQNHQLIPNSL